MQNRIITVVVGAIIKDNKILLTKRQEWDVPEYEDLKSGPWQIPGGGHEFGETLEEGTIREIKEETNLDIEIKSLLPKIFQEVRGSWHGLFIVFLCTLKNPHQPVVINNEACDWGWYSLDEVKNLPCLPKTAEVVELAFKCYNAQ